MSYNIAIVVPPVPADDRDAWACLDDWIGQQGEIASVFRTLHDRLTSTFPCLSSLSDDEIDEGVWSDGPLIHNFGQRAAVLGISYSRVDEVLPFVIETANDLGLIVLDWTTETIHRGGGFKGLTLNIDDRPLIYSPTLEHIESAVDAMTPDGGPGFVILQNSSQSYAQSAGGDGSYVAEWREYSGESFQHWAAGLPELSSVETVSIPTNGYQVTVQENERLGAADVKAILRAFAEGKARPSRFVWRDMTDQFE
jgi:hypothetical protein